MSESEALTSRRLNGPDRRVLWTLFGAYEADGWERDALVRATRLNVLRRRTVLARLEKAGLIESRWIEGAADTPRRLMYRLTDAGWLVARRMAGLSVRGIDERS